MRIFRVSQHLLLITVMSLLSLSLAQTTAGPQTDIMLVDGYNNCSGRVEVLYNGVWGNVFSYRWDSQDAAVVCRQLGCGSVVQAAAYFGQGSRYIWLLGVQCTGSETRLQNCASSGWGSYSSVYLDVGVICQSGVRLVDGDNDCSGRVEVLYNGTWGTVCGDSWDLSDAAVVCQQLGCGSVVQSYAYFGQGSGQIWLDDVQCTRNETRLQNCASSGWGVHNCSHSLDVGIICQTGVRLVDGDNFCSGRVEVFLNRSWEKVWATTWDSQDAAVVCRQLGCGSVVQADSYSELASRQFWLGDVWCTGSETRLQNCALSDWAIYSYGNRVKVTCQLPDIFYTFGPTAGDTNLTRSDDGSSSAIELLNPFMFFGHTYRQIYVNNNGHLTFNWPSNEYIPYSFPANGSEDVIAALWTDLDSRERGVVSYQQYRNGSTLTHATRDINQNFPHLTFTATWVFVATWNRVAYFNRTNTETSFQVVLIAGSNLSFILLNYGNIAVTTHSVQAGYDTVNSTEYFVIPGSNNGSNIPNLKNSSNVNIPGQWIFRVDSEPRQNNIPKDKVIGFQVELTSSSDLTDNDRIKIILQKIKEEMARHGLPSTLKLNSKSVKKANP